MGHLPGWACAGETAASRGRPGPGGTGRRLPQQNRGQGQGCRARWATGHCRRLRPHIRDHLVWLAQGVPGSVRRKAGLHVQLRSPTRLPPMCPQPGGLPKPQPGPQWARSCRLLKPDPEGQHCLAPALSGPEPTGELAANASGGETPHGAGRPLPASLAGHEERSLGQTAQPRRGTGTSRPCARLPDGRSVCRVTVSRHRFWGACRAASGDPSGGGAAWG